MDSTARLHASIEACCPIEGISIGTPGDSSSVAIDYAGSATSDQRSAAQTALEAFDWSDEAQAAWELGLSQAAATVRLSATDPVTIAVRGLALQCLDAINASSAAIAELQNQVRNLGGTIALSPAPVLTAEQGLAAIASIIDSGRANG